MRATFRRGERVDRLGTRESTRSRRQARPCGAAPSTFLADNAIKEANRDVIQDFHRGDDIDLSTIDAKQGGADQAFHFIGTKAFTHHAGELRFSDLGATCLVQGDTNGDGRADFDILVKAGTLSHGDFVL